MKSVDAGLSIPDAFASYELQCPCGRNTWRVLGNWYRDTAEFVGPLYAECSSCTSRLRIIDTAIDGFNGEIGDGIAEEDAAHEIWICPECSTAEGSLITSFGYQFEPDGEVAVRQQDYFDAFILTHICLESLKTVEIAMFDCA